MFKLQHQYNNIVETTQLTNNQMPEFIVTMNVQSVEAPTQASSRLIWEIFHSLVDRSLRLVAPDDLKCFFEFGARFWLSYKFAVSL